MTIRTRLNRLEMRHFESKRVGIAQRLQEALEYHQGGILSEDSMAQRMENLQAVAVDEKRPEDGQRVAERVLRGAQRVLVYDKTGS